MQFATHDLVEIIRVKTKGRNLCATRSWRRRARFCPTTIPDIEYGRGEIEKQITERTAVKNR